MFICCCAAVWSIYINVVHRSYRLSQDNQQKGCRPEANTSLCCSITLTTRESPTSVFSRDVSSEQIPQQCAIHTYNPVRKCTKMGLIYPHLVQTFPLTAILRLLLLCSRVWSLIAQCKSSMFIFYLKQMNWELVILDFLFREHISSLQEILVIFPSLFQDLCDMLVANRLSILNRMIWIIIHLV